MQNERLVERLLKMDEILDQRVAPSLKAHGDGLHELGDAGPRGPRHRLRRSARHR